MPSKVEAFGLLLVLLPGLLCAYIVQALAVRRAQSEVEKVVEALILSFLLYVFTLPWFEYGLPVSWQQITTGSNQFRIVLRWEQLSVLGLSSVLVGILYASCINHDWVLRFFRWLKVTERSARSTIWNDVFGQIGGWIQVGLADERSSRVGLPYYSDDPEESSLFLEQAAWIMKDGTEDLIDGPGVLITREMKIEYVVFLRSRDAAVLDAEESA